MRPVSLGPAYGSDFAERSLREIERASHEPDQSIWVLDGNNIYNANTGAVVITDDLHVTGQVGIGTTTPHAGAKLHVVGGVLSSGVFTSNVASSGGFDYFSTGLRLFSVGASGATKGTFQFIGVGADGSSALRMSIDNAGVLTLSAYGAGVLKTSGSGVVTAGTVCGATSSFSAHKNGTDQTGIASATHTKVTFTTETFDEGSHYDASNSKWTPPAGKVLVAASLYVQTTANGFFAVSIYKNGALYKASIGAGSLAPALSVTIVDSANGTDYYEVYVFESVAAGTVTVGGLDYQSHFHGSVLQ